MTRARSSISPAAARSSGSGAQRTLAAAEHARVAIEVRLRRDGDAVPGRDRLPGGRGRDERAHDAVDEVVDVDERQQPLAAARKHERPGAHRLDGRTVHGTDPGP